MASVQATVDGEYRFAVRGGQGNDVIVVIQDIDTNWRRTDRMPGSAPIPSIRISLEGNEGYDWIGLGLFAHDIDDDLVHTLIDGG